jgi:SagB-type dehydrogenase family enzyme
MKKAMPALLILGLILLMCPFLPLAQDAKVIKLPGPQTDGGRPLMQVLKARQTSREFGPETKMPMQTLANLLWAADGMNRPDGKRTAPSAVGWQNIDIYVAMADGLYLYDAPQHSLKLLVAEDVRAATGQQAFVKTVPVNLVYVADYAKAKSARGKNPKAEVWSAAGAGFISQNVYLYCASEGLATVVRGMFDKDALGKVLNLRPDQEIILTQSVGYPKKQ